MASGTSDSKTSVTSLIMIPALITLGITVVRLVGELQHWPNPWFSNNAGGGAAIVGIVWLVFILGPYFALKLAGAGESPASSGKAIGFAVLGLILLIAGSFVAFAPKPVFPGKTFVGVLLMVAAVWIQFGPWPALAKTLLTYGYAARIPVAVVMFLAIRGNWGTHYDVLPPEYAGPLVFWVAFTVNVGVLFGTIAAVIAHRGKPATQPAT